MRGHVRRELSEVNRKSCKYQGEGPSRLNKKQKLWVISGLLRPLNSISGFYFLFFFVFQCVSFDKSLMSAQLVYFLFVPFLYIPFQSAHSSRNLEARGASGVRTRRSQGCLCYSFKTPGEYTGGHDLSHLPGALDRTPESKLWPHLLPNLHHWQQGVRGQPRRGKQLSCVWYQIFTWKLMA